MQMDITTLNKLNSINAIECLKVPYSNQIKLPTHAKTYVWIDTPKAIRCFFNLINWGTNDDEVKMPATQPKISTQTFIFYIINFY